MKIVLSTYATNSNCRNFSPVPIAFVKSSLIHCVTFIHSFWNVCSSEIAEMRNEKKNERERKTERGRGERGVKNGKQAKEMGVIKLTIIICSAHNISSNKLQFLNLGFFLTTFPFTSQLPAIHYSQKWPIVHGEHYLSIHYTTNDHSHFLA